MKDSDTKLLAHFNGAEVACYHTAYTSPAKTWGPADKRDFYEVHFVDTAGRWFRIYTGFGWNDRNNNRVMARVILTHHFARRPTTSEITRLENAPQFPGRIEVVELEKLFNQQENANMAKRKERDGKVRAANDNTERKAEEPFNGIPLKETVGKVMDGIKGRKKRLPNVVETDEKRTVAVRYDFNEAEIRAISQQLAQRQIELVEVEDEKKSVMASFTDRVKAKKIDIGKFSRQVRDGWENRDHNCILILDFKKREKRYKDAGTKKIVKVEAFGPGDDQRRFI